MELNDKFENSSKIKIQQLRLKDDQVFFWQSRLFWQWSSKLAVIFPHGGFIYTLNSFESLVI